MDNRITVRLDNDSLKELDKILAALQKDSIVKLTRSDVIRYLINKDNN